MAELYVRSLAGGTNAGTSWGNGYISAVSALNVANHAAGDTIFIAHDHVEPAFASLQTWNTDGTAASPVRILCVDDTANYASTSHGVPTTLATMATPFTSNTTIGHALGIGFAYAYGLGFSLGAGTSGTASMLFATTASTTNMFWSMENCDLRLNNTSASSAIVIGSNPSSMTTGIYNVEWKNCQVRFGGVGQHIRTAETRFKWHDTSRDALHASSTVPTTLFIPAAASHGHALTLEDLNLSALTTVLVNVAGATSVDFNASNVQLGSGCVITTGTHPGYGGVRVTAVNVDSGDTNYKAHHQDYPGKVTVSTSIYVTTDGGATQHNAADVFWSFQVEAGAGALRYAPCYTPWIPIWNPTTGSRTLTVEAAQDGTATALKDTELWLEIRSLNTAGKTLGTVSRSNAVDVLSAGSNLSAGSTSWTGLNATNTRYSLAKTVTIAEQGPIMWRAGTAANTLTNKVHVSPRGVLT